ncbi:MAG: Rrf2 family transcriptional regulator [Treponema sp.]|jgi:Rrf2 family iron-sulfur cluster assembly transcriptional regulator|nr:Rrf2 family transcriptional regulator [Treponema sp.]
MRITTRGRYALRASLALAKMENEGNPVSINQLSEMENISPVFLEQIFFKLRKAGIVKSMRGPGGGFNFEKALDKLTVKEILDAAGEELNITSCDRRIENCGKIGECLSHQVWLDLSQLVNDYLAQLTLASVMEKYGNVVTDSGDAGTAAV